MQYYLFTIILYFASITLVKNNFTLIKFFYILLFNMNFQLDALNIGTEFKKAWAHYVTESLTTEQESWKIAIKARDAIGRVINHKISLCGANQRA